jgi:hypothetical protein
MNSEEERERSLFFFFFPFCLCFGKVRAGGRCWKMRGGEWEVMYIFCIFKKYIVKYESSNGVLTKFSEKLDDTLVRCRGPCFYVIVGL